jgi:hypothetical protein
VKRWQTWDAFTDQTDGWDTTRVDNGTGVQRVATMPGCRTEPPREPELWDEGLIDR